MLQDDSSELWSMWSSTVFSSGEPAQQSSWASPVPQLNWWELCVSRAHSPDFGLSDLEEGHRLQFTRPLELSCWWTTGLEFLRGAGAGCSHWRVWGQMRMQVFTGGQYVCLSVKVFEGSSGQIRVFKNLTTWNIFILMWNRSSLRASDLVFFVNNSTYTYLGSSNARGKGCIVHTVPVRAGV